ncbi:hypothetical protein Nepgr_014893 [Nepenthes gracilis]|uniref:Uncharacterized protein n=1 Tax=Nepenthes gracilis TaxID=150966 RepID=A0AAD3SM38_NEPGR|nr:hypothetical protein Nepgr_014893 [Nepenthes gracilis]
MYIHIYTFKTEFLKLNDASLDRGQARHRLRTTGVNGEGSRAEGNGIEAAFKDGKRSKVNATTAKIRSTSRRHCHLARRPDTKDVTQLRSHQNNLALRARRSRERPNEN